VTAKFWRNFADRSTDEQGFPEPDATVWLNVDAYMCPWRYSLLHSLSTGKPMVLSFFDERPARSVQDMLSTKDRFAASFGETQREKCDEMSGTLYGFKWLAHKANQDWNITKRVNTALIDVFLPVAPNQFTAQDKEAPRYTDPSTLVTRPLGLNEWLVRSQTEARPDEPDTAAHALLFPFNCGAAWLTFLDAARCRFGSVGTQVGVWYDREKQGAGLTSVGAEGAKRMLMQDAAGGHQEL